MLIWTDALDKKLIELNGLGRRDAEIAKVISDMTGKSVSYDSVRYRRKHLNLPLRSNVVRLDWSGLDPDLSELAKQRLHASDMARILSAKHNMSVSRCAVLGRMRRLGIPMPMTPEEAAGKRMATKRLARSKAPPRAKTARKIAREERLEVLSARNDWFGGVGIPFASTTFPIRQCRWPLERNSDGEPTCCGQPTHEKSSYCKMHYIAGTKIAEDSHAGSRQGYGVGVRRGNGKDHLWPAEVHG